MPGVLGMGIRGYSSNNFNMSITQITQGSEFSRYEIKLRNRVTQNDVTLRVTNLIIFKKFLFRVTNSTS